MNDSLPVQANGYVSSLPTHPEHWASRKDWEVQTLPSESRVQCEPDVLRGLLALQMALSRASPRLLKVSVNPSLSGLLRVPGPVIGSPLP